MSEPAAPAGQRTSNQNAAVKVVEPPSLSERVKQIQEAIARRAFELYLDEGSQNGRDVEHWIQAEAELLQPMPLTITESGDALTVRAEVPGFTAAELQIGIEPGRLTIAGRKETKHADQTKAKTIHSERRSNEILRVVSLPASVDGSKATATLSNGVIELILPKTLKAKAATAE
jgi:HSP20 family molecular chaperone IbpA